MKNLSAIHRLSLLETFTILITLVVCLAGFTEAEGSANYKKQDSNQPKEENYLRKEALLKENAPYYQPASGITNEEPEGRHFDDMKTIADPPLDNFVKKESDDFGESDESDQKEGDGYGYDDDEYYHFNIKRSETNLDSKAEKEGVHEINEKEGISGQKKGLGTKDKTKEIETIEMLNFKESHPNIGIQNDQNPNENQKPYNDETSRKKVPNAPIIASLKMSDLRENSAIDEKIKDRKDESDLSGSPSDTKLTDSKKQAKTTDEKDSIKLKDTQLGDDSEKKEKDTSLKDGKEVVAAKTLKDTPEEKDKGAKLSENVKLEDTIDKMTSKTKETDLPKIAKEETEESKVASDLINPNGLSQMSNRASFVNNDFKDNAEITKTAEAVEEENSEVMSGIDANAGLNDHQKEDLRRSRERFRKLYNVRNIESGGAHLRDNSKTFRDSSKPKEYMPTSEFQNISPNDLFKKRDWKEQVAQNIKFRMQQQDQQQQQPTQEQQYNQDEQQQLAQQMLNQQEQKGESIFHPQLKNSFGLTFPTTELENTEYHKNFIKSLKRYKGLSEEQKNVMPESSSTTTIDKTNLDEEMKNLKKDLKDPLKRRSTLLEEPNKRLKFGRNSPNNGNFPQSDSQSCILEPLSSQSSPKLTKDTKLKDSSRIRRKSQKVEYEIKVFNQNQQGEKNAELSQGPKRVEKDLKVKTRLDKYSKKYPYSQASRDDLTKITDVDGDSQFTRKAPITKRQDQKSVIQTRAAPSGYYSNRVKFGQKNYARNNERTIPEAFRQTQVPSPTLIGQAHAANDKNKMLRSWELLQPNYRHESIKRFDAAGSANKGNSLLLVRKGDRITTAFEEGTAHSDNDLSPDNLAKILSNNNDYIVLKKTESNKFQKISEKNPSLNEYNAASYPTTFSAEDEQQESQKNGAKQTLKNRGLFVRASHYEKDKKSSSGFHSSKSNLKKTFAKFRDLAGFFKDNEQESADNQYPTQELKEGRDIVFSEDKRPDPIVINSDMNEKNINQKPLNSIYSISNNFKTLDQPDKKSDVPAGSEPSQNMFTAEAKADGPELSWGSTIKNLFPEAKTVNTIAKNGNEIIVLDLNRNQLKTNHGLNTPSKAANPKAQLGAFGFTSQIPSGKDKKSMLILGSNLQQGPSPLSFQKTPLKTIAQSNKAYALVKGSQNHPTQLEDLPNLLRTLMEMKPSSSKVIKKRSPAKNKVSENYNKFLRDLSELSELNKNSNKKTKLEKKRDTLLPSSSFPELSNYGDANIKYLGSLLQNIMTGENPQFKALNDGTYETINSQYSEENRKSNQLNSGGLDAERNSKYQGKWSLEEDKNKDTPENKEDNDFEASEERNYHEKLWDELAATSDKINRLRREGAGKKKLRKVIEDSLDFKQKSGSNTEDSNLSFGPNLNGEPDSKERSGGEKSDYEDHLSELFENLNRNQKNLVNIPNESTWRRKKRKENQRKKRSPGVDNKNRVSTTTAVQNTILKTLPEDNYQSVYSPGIKRMLLSTKNEADNADNYSDAYEHDKDVTFENDQANCVRNKLNHCVDPIIVELFKEGDLEEQKTRARRSLNAGFHSNFKREIDLDESMPNDFQSFLVTSLGGFGSQKREVMKKDDALWEGKATSQDSSGTGDSALEKRDVSSSEKRKSSTYKNEFYSPASNPETNILDVMGSLHHTEKKVRSDEKSKLKGKSEFADEKLPTQIRIQITNASMKEKKSSKPIMDESETTSTETENLPKEKEFFDKGKISTARGNNLPKLRGPPKSKFSYSDYEEPNNQDESASLGLFRRRRRKKKKYVQENPAKPINDFIKFDSKTMETFLKRIMTDQNIGDQTTQKIPVSNHLPQVETVYNPTQGTNKAQLETTRFGKLNSGNNRNSASDKNNMLENYPNTFGEEVLRSYLKDKTDKIKSDKGKDYEDVDWKPSSGKMRLRQELGWDPGSVHLPSLKAPIMDSTNSAPPSSYLTPYSQHIYGQKFQPPNSNYFYHPATSNVYNTNSLYDAVKLKQDMKSHNAINEHSVSKLFKKPMHHVESDYSKSEEKDKNTLYPRGEGAWNYDFSLPKKSSSQIFKNRDVYGIKNQNRLDSKNKLTHTGGRKFMMNFEEEKPPIIEPPLSSPPLDNSKDSDYMDGIDEDYLDEPDTNKDSPMDDSLASATRKKSSKLFETPEYHQLYNYKNLDLDDNVNEDDEEVDEDYDENNEDDDFDDYTLLTNTKADPDVMRNGHGRNNFDSSFQPNSAFSPLNYVLPKDNLLELRGHSFEQTEFTDPRSEAKGFSQGKQFPIGDVKSELDSISSSSALLKKANENSNILEKNLMKSGFGNYDDNLTNQEKSSEKIKDNARLHHNKLTKRRLDMQKKYKRSRDYPQIGSRLFYAAKTEINNVNPFTLDFGKSKKTRNNRHSIYRRNPLYAEFADPDNGFENDSEKNGEQFNGNLPNLGKNSDEEKNKEKDEEADLTDVAENLEDDGETISEDNVLENVIGKYIMRKRVASPTELNKAFENPLKKREGESENKHKLNKRSSVKLKRSEKITPLVKVVRKRLSSGHLTENNFRKYHKKNLNKKRQILLAISTDGTGDGNRKTKKRGNPSVSKRSALDLFKKITNKDRDNKKLENVDGRTAGFEPLSSLSDKKYESSIHDFKLEHQEKTLSSESPENQFQNNLAQFKTHFPNEISLVVEQQKKEKAKESPGSPAQGPWKIELNDDSETDKFPRKTENSEKMKATGAPDDEEGLKAFLVFSTRPKAGKRSSGEESPLASGSLQKEVGNSHQPKSGEGRRIFKRHVRKRSLDSSLVIVTHEDAAQGRFAQEQTTENYVSFEDKNRALHDTMSLFTSQPSRVLQRNSKKIRSFVNADEQCQTDRFPPKGRLNKRQSVFPPSNDANNFLAKSEKGQPRRKINKRLTNPSQIMRDSRHVNEETSKYLGEQIVDAILSHVSANPKFKELIAPGLAARTTAYKEDIDIKKRPVHQADVSKQLQLFLQKFMYDLERLAEKRVQKRMCNEIDPQSRQFLESLLRVPVNSPDNKKTFDEKLCVGDNSKVKEASNLSGSTTEKCSSKPPTNCTRSQSPQEQELENLKKKHSLLLKLIEDYEKLTKLEKESLRVKYNKLVKELQVTRTQLESQNDNDFCSKNNSVETNSKPGFENAEEAKTIQLQCLSYKQSPKESQPSEGNTTLSKPSNMDNSDLRNEAKKPKPASQTPFFDDEIMKNSISAGTKTTKVSNEGSPAIGDSKKGHVLPTLFFDEEIMKNSGVSFSKSTPSPVFENVEAVNLNDSSQRHGKTGNTAGGGPQPRKNEALLQTLQTPQSFDLLPCQNFTQKLNNPRTNQPPESVQIKEFLSGANTFENSDNRPPDLEIPLGNQNRRTELHKLSLKDEIGLQLLLKKPWMKNSDVLKPLKNVPSQLDETILGLEESRSLHGNANDVPTVGDTKGQSLIAPSNELSPSDAQTNSFGLPIYPFFKSTMFVPRKSPFETVSKSYWDLENEQIPLNFFLRKDATTTKKQHRSTFSASSVVKQKPTRLNTFDEKVEQKEQILPLFLPSSLNNKRKKSSGLKGVENEVDAAALEYLKWSNMPTVRRQMNNLEKGFEFDEFFSQDPKQKKT